MRTLCLYLFICSSCLGQLVFDHKELDFHPGPEEKNLTAEYPFHNAGTYAVTITSMKPSCGCTTATLDKREYAPGEKGVIKAVFDFGTRTGQQDKDIVVMTSDPVNQMIRLMLHATIPKLMQISPSFVLWMLGEETLPKTIYIKVTNPTPIKVVKVSSDNPRLPGELKTIKEGSEYLYIITPSTTAQAEKATLQIHTDYPAKQPRVFTAYAEIKPVPTSINNQESFGRASATVQGRINPPPGVKFIPAPVETAKPPDAKPADKP